MRAAWPNDRTAVKRSYRRFLPWFAVPLGLLVLAWAAKRAHRLTEPAALSADEMRQSLALAHATLDGRTPLDELARPLGRPVTEPVFVSIYVPGRVGDEPRLGSWRPTPAEPTTSLGHAIEVAGREASARLAAEKLPADRLAQARWKVDLAGPSRRLWAQAGWYLDAVVDPGRDGIVGRAGERDAWWLPSWTVERGASARRALASLPVAGGSFARFRSFSFVDGVEGEPGPLVLMRGNVLRDRFDVPLLRDSLEQAGLYLARSVQPDGRFCYSYDAGKNGCDSDYNLLRHAGTTYALFQLYREFKDPAMRVAAERTTAWLRRQVRPVEGDPSRSFLLEGDRAKLGAVGLAMLALVEREKAIGDGVDRALLTRLADFVRSQQRADGYFASYFRWSDRVNVPTDNSIYYPGEALLGLVRLHGIDPQPRYLDSATRAAEFLVKRRWRWGGIELYVPPDAWLTQALAELDAVAPADWMASYTYSIVQTTELTMLRADEGAPIDLAGGPGAGPTMPNVIATGSRSEGLASAYRLAQRRGDRARADAILRLALLSGRFQVGQQFRPANSYFLPDPGRARGGIRSAPHHLDVRIDTVQHNATGLLGLLSILREARP